MTNAFHAEPGNEEMLKPVPAKNTTTTNMNQIETKKCTNFFLIAKKNPFFTCDRSVDDAEQSSILLDFRQNHSSDHVIFTNLRFGKRGSQH